MDKTRESRRSSIASSSTNGFPKRKHQNITLRDSSEKVAVELKEDIVREKVIKIEIC
jgi:hypothetical protein